VALEVGFAGFFFAPFVYSFALAFVAPLLLAVAARAGWAARGTPPSLAAGDAGDAKLRQPLLARAAAAPSARLLKLRGEVAAARTRVQLLRSSKRG
jgi:hypothetical protein